MTNHWVDLQNCKTILVEGSNVAENHPMAYKWIRKAQENGAKLIHVDPRYTRTSAGADVYARIRPGTDAAFQNTMINHIIVNKLYDEDYVVTHTNALYLGDEAFDFKDGRLQRLRRGAPQVRHQDLGIPARREGQSARRQEPGRPALRVLAPEDVRLALHAGDGRADHRRSGRSDPADRRDDGEEPAGIHPLRARDDPAHDRRAGDPRRSRSCSSCSATSASPAAASTRCAASRTCRAPATWRCSTTTTRATSTRRPMPSRRSTTTCARTGLPTAGIS